MFDGGAEYDEVCVGEAFGEIGGSVGYGALAEGFLKGGGGAADADYVFADAALEGGHAEGAAEEADSDDGNFLKCGFHMGLITLWVYCGFQLTNAALWGLRRVE